MDSERIINALAASLVMADLADSGQRGAFLAEVRSAIRAQGHPVLSAMADEIEAVFGQVEEGTLEPGDAAATLAEYFVVAAEACAAEARASENVGAAGGPEPVAEREAAQDGPNCYAADSNVVADFVAEALEQLDGAEALLSSAAVGDHVDVPALFRCIHTIKGMSGFLSLDELAQTGHEAETLLDAIRSEGREMSEPEVESVLKSVDAMRKLVSAVQAPGAEKAGTAERERKRSAEQVRVNAQRLEQLLDAMGELAVAEAELATLIKGSKDHALVRGLERLERISRDMQATATTLRMVSLKQTFAKMSRIVRDGIAKSGKSAELVVSGEGTEIDRAIVEGLSDPLVHLLRNAIDHGIEPASERVAAGKPAQGRLEVRAFHRSGSVYIEIEDDGSGIDPERLIRRATELGVEYDRDHPLSLIFKPGFSTAQTVTELSGRGVGMDAVAAAVAGMRGQLDIASEPGTGTRFTIRLPLTLAVIDGIVLRAGLDRYVVPTHFVERTVGAMRSTIVSAAGRGEMLVLPDGPVPVASIAGTMGGATDTGEVAVILIDGDTRFAVLVDEVIGQQSLVIKPLTGPTAEAVGPAGAALMGDGRVALVVDPAGLSKAMRRGW